MTKKRPGRLEPQNEEIASENRKTTKEVVQDESKHEEHNKAPATGCLLRLFWMLVGNAILLFCILGIAQHRSSMLSIADVFYWAIVSSLLAARYIDIRHLGGTTADGDPATLAHWRRYAMVLGVVSMMLWLGAHVAAYCGK